VKTALFPGFGGSITFIAETSAAFGVLSVLVSNAPKIHISTPVKILIECLTESIHS
jgi:hypothetical protein